MSFIATLQRAREILAQQGRLSTRALERELEIGGADLDEIIEELVDVQQVARREGKILVWAGTPASRPLEVVHAPETRPTPPTQSADTAGARKVVTIIFADLVGSTSLHERLDAESVTRLMDRYYGTLRGAVEAHGGTVVKLLGDGVMAAFGVPRVAEDDAIRAVRAGVAMQEAFRELARRGVRGRGRPSGCASASTPARSWSAPTTPTSSATRSTSPRGCRPEAQRRRGGDRRVDAPPGRGAGDAGAARQLRAQGPRGGDQGVSRRFARPPASAPRRRHSSDATTSSRA